MPIICPSPHALDQETCLPSLTTTTGRILLVDDQPVSLRVVTQLLQRQGHEVSSCTRGEDALAECLAHPPDLILLDMMMPGMDGFELLGQIRKNPKLASIPAIFLTAAQDQELLLRAFESGVVDYVTKPFLAEELLARVNAHLVLKLTRDRLERVAAERQNLVNLVAHDLKNPLTSVLFASEMLMLADVEDARKARYQKIIHEATQDALGYIKSYLESQSKPPDSKRQQHASLHKVVDWLLERYTLQLEARGIAVSTRLPEQAAMVSIAPKVLRQVAENLVTNASKYAASGGELMFWVRTGAPGYWQLVVQDRGPGIAPARQRELFKPFTRLSEHDPANGLSSGLGLALARQIIAAAGGHLFYEDREGGGARFVIELPEAHVKNTATHPAGDAVEPLYT
ncbi:hybrid sensor histidine kinase/response regulator [Lysobacteraceae bacterium NML75-0749]|nr:hybrid sensor histidine kinase/response regulator [Xanthomonadaceae bacterium NML75-0749]PJK04455.1 hybrid sensor histidine kinase/response regulator [Xanthomonadaceae bacterium NML91-0268]